MKRLIKKVAGKNLSHSTSFTNFISICQDGAIKPFNSANVNQHSNSLDQNSVYVTESSGFEFARDFIGSDQYSTSVCLKVNVDESQLLPSYDIFEFDAVDVEVDENGEEYVDVNGKRVNKKDLTWRDTLDLNDECRHNGEIPLDSIQEVVFFTSNETIRDLLQNNNRKSIEEAKQIIDQFLES